MELLPDTSKVTSKDTEQEQDVQRLNASQLTYLGYIQTGLPPGKALECSKVDSDTLHNWRQNDAFRRTEASLHTASISLGSLQAKRLAELSSTYVMGRTLAMVDDARHDRDRLTAASMILKASGALNDSISVNVQVNVGQSAKAYLSQTTDDTPRT